jgi:hypothetical protein
MPSVSVERVPVQTLNLGLLGFDHLQLVFRPFADRPRQDDWFVIEGFREPGAGGVRLAVDGWDGGTTLSEANGGRFGAALSDRIGESGSRGARVIAEDGQAMQVWSTFVSYAAEIDAQRFPYVAIALPASPIPTINSSSLVASLLHYAGIDAAEARPAGLRFSPGMSTLLGTSMDDTLRAGSQFTTLVAGDGNDTLSGGNARGRTDKLLGGGGDDTFHWSAGRNIIHGGQPGLDRAADGVDTVDYTGVGALVIEAVPRAALRDAPDFIARHAGGEDRLYSIEEIVWDASTDSVALGPGVVLAPREPAVTGISAPGTPLNERTAGARLLMHRSGTADEACLAQLDLHLAIECSLLFCGPAPGEPGLAAEYVHFGIGAGG